MNSAFKVKETDKLKAIAHFRAVSRNYDASVSKGPFLTYLRNRERAAMFQMLFDHKHPPKSGEWLLDVGTGGGLYALEAKQRGMRVCAIDTVEEMIAPLRSLLDEARVADIENLRFSRQYDRIVCAGVLDFVIEPERAFRTLCEAVAPGGRLVILAPRDCSGGLIYRLEKKLIGIHVNLFRSDWFARIAREHDLTLSSELHPVISNMALLFERVNELKLAVR